MAPTNGGPAPSPAGLWPLARLFGVLVEIAGGVTEGGSRTPSAAADAEEDPPRPRPPERSNAAEPVA